MEILYSRCCGLDVHKASVTACCRWLDGAGRSPQKEIRRFGTYTADLLDLGQWLQQRQVQQVAMESTGSYWRPVWNVLESQGLPLLLANAQHIKNLPGRKTDTLDPEWISDLLMHGLIKPSFVPDRKMRDLRDLTRMRTKVVQDHTRVANRIQAILEDANIKLGNVVSDILGVSSRAMLAGLMENRPAGELAELAQGRLRAKLEDLEKALQGDFRPEHGFLLKRMLMQTRFLEQQERALRAQIVRHLDGQTQHAVALWDTIPGVNEATGWVLAAEMGTRERWVRGSSNLPTHTMPLVGLRSVLEIAKAGASADPARRAKEILGYERHFPRRLGRHRELSIRICRPCIAGWLDAKVIRGPSWPWRMRF